MGMINASGAIAIALLGTASVMAADVRPSVVGVVVRPAVSVVGISGRAGFKRSHKSSDLAPAVLPIALIAAAAAAGGAVAATSGNGGHSNNSPTVSRS